MKSKLNHRAEAGGLRRRVVRNLVLLGGSNGLGALLSLLAAAANSRALSPTDFGTLILLQSAALLLGGLISFSTQQPVIKLGIKALEAGETRRFERLVGLGFALDLLASVLACGVGLVLVLVLPGVIGIPSQRIMPALIVVGSLLFQGYKTSEGIFRAFDRFGLMGSIQIAVAALQMTTALLLWWLHAPFVWYVWLVAGIVALPPIVQALLSLRLLRHHGLRPRLKGIRAMADERREFIDYCWTTSLTSTGDTIRYNGDSTLVGALISVEAAGVYGVAKQLAGVVRKAAVIYASVVFPELASMAAGRRFAAASAALRKATTLGLLFAGLVVAAAALLGRWALGFIFGPAFIAGHGTLILLIAAAGLQIVSATYSMFVQAFVGPVALLWAYLVATAAFAISAVLALTYLGVAGGGVAQIVFVVALAATCRYILRRDRALEEKEG